MANQEIPRVRAFAPVVPIETIAQLRPAQDGDIIRASIETLPLKVNYDINLKALFKEVRSVEPQARSLLMRLPSPESTIAYENSFEARSQRFEGGAELGFITRGDRENLPLLGCEVRDCLLVKANLLFERGLQALASEEVELEARTRDSIIEIQECFQLYRYELSPVLSALARYQNEVQRSGGVLQIRELGEDAVLTLSQGMERGIMGVGVYFGAPARNPLLESLERDEQWRVLERTNDSRNPVECCAAGTGHKDGLNAPISELNEVDLGATWATLQKSVDAGDSLTSDELGFILRAAERMKDLYLQFTDALLCTVLQDLELFHGLDSTNESFALIEYAEATLFRGEKFQGAIAEICNREYSHD